MRLKKTKALSFLLILALSLQLTGCLGITNGTPSTPNDTLISLMASVRNYQKDEFLGILMIDKGSSIYREYDEILDLDAYTADAAKCYKTVASGIETKYDESSIDSKSDIVKVKVTFLTPAWKELFEDDTFSGPDGICAKLEKADKNKTEMTLRLIKTKDGYKIKNHEDLMEIFDFVGYEIAGLAGKPYESNPSEPTESTEPTEPTEPKPTEPSTTDPQPTQPQPTDPSGTKPSDPNDTDPSDTEPSGTEDTTGPSRVTAYSEYKKIIEENKSDIEWYEKTFNKHSCGLSDFNNDNVPELFFFVKSKYSENYVNFCVYTFNPTTKKTSLVLLETLTQAGSDISEFFVSRTKDGHLITYRGYISDGSSILTYNLYASAGKSPLTFTGNMFCTITPTIKDKDGNETNANVCTLTGVDKYKEHTSVSLEEYRRVEKEVLSSTEVLISASFQKSENSPAKQILGSYNQSGTSCAELLNIFNM